MTNGILAQRQIEFVSTEFLPTMVRLPLPALAMKLRLLLITPPTAIRFTTVSFPAAVGGLCRAVMAVSYLMVPILSMTVLWITMAMGRVDTAFYLAAAMSAWEQIRFLPVRRRLIPVRWARAFWALK